MMMMMILTINLLLLYQVSGYAFNTNNHFHLIRKTFLRIDNYNQLNYNENLRSMSSPTAVKSTSSSTATTSTSTNDGKTAKVKLTLAQSYDITTFIQELSMFHNIAGVFVLETIDNKAYYIGAGANIVQEVEIISAFYKSLDFVQNVRVQTFSVYNPAAVEAYKQELIRITNPPANLLLQYTKQQQQQSTSSLINDGNNNSNMMASVAVNNSNSNNSNSNKGMSEIERKLQSLKQIVKQTPAFSTPTRIIEFQESSSLPSTATPPSSLSSSPLSSSSSSSQIPQTQPSSSSSSSSSSNKIISPFDSSFPSSSSSSATTATQKSTSTSTTTASPPAAATATSGQQMVKLATCETTLDFTVDNVNKVLDQIRPMLISDGGNVAVVSIDKVTRGVKLLLQGACGSCPSSTTTMKMGIERVLKENFVNLGPVTAVSAEELRQELIEVSETGNISSSSSSSSSSSTTTVADTNIINNNNISKNAINTDMNIKNVPVIETILPPVASVEEIIEKFTSQAKAADVLTIEKVTDALSNISKAIKGLGGKFELISVNGSDTATNDDDGKKIGQVKLKFQGPDRLRKGIELVLKDISSVTSVVVEEF